VIPGFTDRRLNCQRSYCFTSSSRGGRGPMSDISPFTTLNSWGNSSIPVFLRNLPTLVIRGSSLILNTGPSASFLAWSFFSCSSASTTMVRNLNSLNFLPLRPIRSCLKNIGPLDPNLIIRAMVRKTGNKSITAIMEKYISPMVFRIRERLFDGASTMDRSPALLRVLSWNSVGSSGETEDWSLKITPTSLQTSPTFLIKSISTSLRQYITSSITWLSIMPFTSCLVGMMLISGPYFALINFESVIMEVILNPHSFCLRRFSITPSEKASAMISTLWGLFP